MTVIVPFFLHHVKFQQSNWCAMCFHTHLVWFTTLQHHRKHETMGLHPSSLLVVAEGFTNYLFSQLLILIYIQLDKRCRPQCRVHYCIQYDKFNKNVKARVFVIHWTFEFLNNNFKYNFTARLCECGCNCEGKMVSVYRHTRRDTDMPNQWFLQKWC